MAASPTVPALASLAAPLTDAETLAAFDPAPGSAAARTAAHIDAHPLVGALRADPRFVAARPHLKIPAAMRARNLTAGTLLADDAIPAPPLTFATRDGSALVAVYFLGDALCGHPGIVHGGLLATLLDEGLARCCFPALPTKVGVTASLKIDYRAPCRSGQYVVLRAETTRVDGRKAWVRGWIETLPDPDPDELANGSSNGVLANGFANGEKRVNGVEKKEKEPVKLVEAEALFVEPRGASKMPRIYASEE
ncbi:HotDog domain-containing protein [Lineolata rhizophorae]|uniref:HotDog domain-containing protein n=1 Tax=Lineolata rhizophorae TaxID=578093 RepID=A0A6A6P9X4_9PEZI|nr:HotDog domain-containing protein [Lineolata rhizophorae]